MLENFNLKKLTIKFGFMTPIKIKKAYTFLEKTFC